MHEWGLATGVISALRDYAKSRGGKRIVSATIKVGTLSMIDLDLMREALVTLSESAGMRGLRLHVDRADTQFDCNRCGRRWKFSEVEVETRRAVPPEFLVTDESGERDVPFHYFPELAYAWMRCPKCDSKDYEATNATGAILEEVLLEE